MNVGVDSFVTASVFALSILLGKEATTGMVALYVSGNIFTGRAIQIVKRFRVIVAGFMSLFMMTVALRDISVFNRFFAVDLLVLVTLLY